ncbi:MAG: hypothetical protein EBZ47_02085 [Chlamydiae bacterium]|nr:hypothetical protein [Chlamydiota bacterium]
MTLKLSFSLSSDNFHQVFLYLDLKDMESMMSVNKSVQQMTQRIFAGNQRASLEKFIHFSIETLAESPPPLKNRLQTILLQVYGLKCPNLPSLKRSLNEVKGQIVDVLKGVEVPVAELFDQRSYPYFFEDISKVILFEKQIQQANLIEDDLVRSHSLSQICSALRADLYFDRAIQLSLTIPSEGMRNQSL